jgi:hypothetical protein
MEKIIRINEVSECKLTNRGNSADCAKLGISHMLNILCCGYSSYDGFEVETTDHKYLILIDNGQCCCESWGYFASEDDFGDFIGKELASVELTDKALNHKKVEESDYYDDEGGIQFVDFKMTNGSVLQFAVYNAHNGYYGHPIIVAKDEDILLADTL